MSEFKTCPLCRFIWQTRDDFIGDPNVELIGYQVNFKELEAGFFLFNHSCGTTLGMEVEHFSDLYRGQLFEERKTGGDSCPGYCLHSGNLEACPAKCECAYVREIIGILRK